MNLYLFASVENAWILAGWTMIHFLWVGTLVALTALFMRLLLRRASASVRYAAALTSFALLAALPIAIATWLAVVSPPLKVADSPWRGGAGGGTEIAALASVPMPAVGPQTTAATQPAETIELHQPANPPAIEAATVPSSPVVASVTPVAEPSLATASSEQPNPSLSGRGISFVDLVEVCIPYLPWLWLIGTPLTFALTATGLVGTRRLRLSSHLLTDETIAPLCAQLATSLRITRQVAVAVCDRIAAPVLIGIIRPIILLPPAALTGYSPEEIEMVLLHELAHVRRWDNLVNLVQRIVESLLFFHPAVWLVSNWVRREREACCDALVVARTEHPHAYAELLVALAAQMPRSVLFHPAASSAMAAGPLRSRIRQILKLDDDPMLVSGKSLAAILGSLLVAATLAGLYLPTPAAAASGDAKRESQTKNNLKNQMLALLNHQAAHKTFPANAIYSSDGKPLLSWRVAILPFIDERKLYDEFHRDEPWDSEHNRKLIARMPDIFKNPKLDEPGKTNYLAVVGDECFMTGTPKKLSVVNIADGTSLTISLVEADPDQAVEWTRPLDWKFDRDRPTQGLGKVWKDHWNHARVDGSLHQVKNSKSSDEVGVHFTRNGRETKSLAESANRPQQQPLGMAEGGPGAELNASPWGIAGEAPFASPPPAGGEAGATMPDGAAGSGPPQDWGSQVWASPQPTVSTEADLKALRKAWDQWGLKLELATAPEVAAAKGRGSLKLVGIGDKPLPPNTPQPLILNTIDPVRMQNVDDIQNCPVIQEFSTATLFSPTGPVKIVFQRKPGAQANVLHVVTKESTTEGTENTEGNAGALASDPMGPDTSENGVVDSWPIGVVFPSPKEGEIAARAWKQLGIKIEPSNNDAQLAHDGHAHALKVVGGIPLAPVHEGHPVFLLSLGGYETKDFDALNAALDKVKGQKLVVAKCVSSLNQRDPVWIDVAIPGSAKPKATVTSVGGVGTPQTTPKASAAHPKFPTLENQKLADLAWKRLGLELEPIGEVDLKRVQALGYDGGVKVVRGSAGVQGQDEQVLPTDLLVGLHVWPTTNMQEVAEVLNRDDLDELNPLKFYIVRNEQSGPPTAENPREATFHDIVRTGRLSVQAGGGSSPRRTRPTSSSSSNRYEPVPQNDVWGPPSPAPASPPLGAIQLGVPESPAPAPKWSVPTPNIQLVPAPLESALEGMDKLARQGVIPASERDEWFRRQKEATEQLMAGAQARFQAAEVAKAKAVAEQAKSASVDNDHVVAAAQKESEKDRQEYFDAKRQLNEINRYLDANKPDKKTPFDGSTNPPNEPNTKPRPVVAENGWSTTTTTASPPLAALPGETTPPPLPRSPEDHAQVQSARSRLLQIAREHGGSQSPLGTPPSLPTPGLSYPSPPEPRDPAASRTFTESSPAAEPWKEAQTDTRPTKSLLVGPDTKSLLVPKADTSPTQPTAAASPEELEILRDRIKIAEMQFKYLDEQFKKGSKEGTKDRYEIAAYELALAQANLATAEGKPDEALAKLIDAQTHADEAFKAVTSLYDAGRVSYDLLRNEANRLAEIKLKVARLKRENKQQSQSSPTKPRPVVAEPASPTLTLPTAASPPATSTAVPSTPNSSTTTDSASPNQGALGTSAKSSATAQNARPKPTETQPELIRSLHPNLVPPGAATVGNKIKRLPIDISVEELKAEIEKLIADHEIKDSGILIGLPTGRAALERKFVPMLDKLRGNGQLGLFGYGISSVDGDKIALCYGTPTAPATFPPQLSTTSPPQQPRPTPPSNTVAVSSAEQAKVAQQPSEPSTAKPNSQAKTEQALTNWRSGRGSSSDEMTIVTYDIPKELEKDARSHAGRPPSRAEWDDNGRLILQATPEYHEHFKQLLANAPKWREPAAARERAKQPIVMTSKEGEPRLDWPIMGLTLKDESDSPIAKMYNRRGKNVVVAEVVPGSPADWLDIRPGDLIQEIGRFQASNVEQVETLIKSLQSGFKRNTVSVRMLGSVQNRTFEFKLLPDESEATPADKPAQTSGYRPTHPAAQVDSIPAAKPVPPTPTQNPQVEKQQNQKPSGSESVIVAHEIPKELEKDVRQYIQRLDDRNVHTNWDTRGRLIMQANQARHDELESLLKSAAEWQKSAAKKDSAGGYIIASTRKVEDQDVLDWPAAGLSFVRDTRTLNTSSNYTGLFVIEVAPGSPAAWNNIRPDDLLTRVDSFRAKSVWELSTIIKTIREGFPNKANLNVEFHRYTPEQGLKQIQAELPLYQKPAEPETLEQRRANRSAATKPEPPGPIDKPAQPTAKPEPKADSPQPTAPNKSTLRYDGKTFDGWQNAWRTELSTDKRIEAVKALATFGANGYGEEAAEAIIEIAGQYDWTSTTPNTVLDPLRAACVEAFGGEGAKSAIAQSIPANDALPALAAAAKSGSRQQKLFLLRVLPGISGPESVAARLTLSKEPDTLVRKKALQVLPQLMSNAHNDKVAARVREALDSDNPDDVVAAMFVIFPYPNTTADKPPYPYLPNLMKSLYSPHEVVRKKTRQLLKQIKGDDATRAANETLAILKDDARKEQHLEAIRALAALGKNAKSAVETLRPLVMSDDQRLAIAATAALKRILIPEDYFALLNEWNKKRSSTQQEFTAFQVAVDEEDKQLFP